MLIRALAPARTRKASNRDSSVDSLGASAGTGTGTATFTTGSGSFVFTEAAFALVVDISSPGSNKGQGHLVHGTEVSRCCADSNTAKRTISTTYYRLIGRKRAGRGTPMVPLP